MINNILKSISYLFLVAVLVPLVSMTAQNYHQQGYYNYPSQMPGTDPNHSTDTYNELLRKAGKSPPVTQGSYRTRVYQQGPGYQQGGYYNQQNYYTNPRYMRQQYYQNQPQSQQLLQQQQQQLQQQQQELQQQQLQQQQ